MLSGKLQQASSPLSRRIHPDLMAQEDVWGADLFCGPAAEILMGNGPRVTLADLNGECFEGWRVSTDSSSGGYDARIEKTPIYRQLNLRAMRFNLESEHWRSPNPEVAQEKWGVQPGDVVLNKLVPIRAVLVTGRTYRHPVDANCLIVRGLSRTASAWVAFCLNQRAYEAYLTQHQGLAVLPRASLRELRQLRLPPPPDEFRFLGERLWSLNDEVLGIEEQLFQCINEVEKLVQQEFQQVVNDQVRLDSYRNGRFLPAEVIEDSLLPKHVANAFLRHQLKQKLGWQKIESLIVQDQESQKRLNLKKNELPYLRLSDVNQDLMVWEIASLPVTQANRIYQKPLAKGEVLLSTFAANPTDVFVDTSFEQTVYISDHWVRLRFQETPAAWALILNTTPIKKQLEGFVMGVVQQFIPAESISKILVPIIPFEIRRKWGQVVTMHHQRKRQLMQEMNGLMASMLNIFREVHQPLMPITKSRDVLKEDSNDA